jgi:nicotinamide mononucleotide transporter
VTLTPELARTTELVATVLGAAYVVLAARRHRLCWLPGALASALVAALSFMRGLPMQGALNLFYIGMAGYGFLNWSRAHRRGELPVGYAPLRWHLIGASIVLPLSWASAEWLARETQAAWPLLDSLTTWFSLFATWLVARARIENWLYWIVIDGLLVYLYYMQGYPILALQFLVFTGLAVAGFVAWRRRLAVQALAG